MIHAALEFFLAIVVCALLRSACLLTRSLAARSAPVIRGVWDLSTLAFSRECAFSFRKSEVAVSGSSGKPGLEGVIESSLNAYPGGDDGKSGL